MSGPTTPAALDLGATCFPEQRPGQNKNLMKVLPDACAVSVDNKALMRGVCAVAPPCDGQVVLITRQRRACQVAAGGGYGFME